MVKKTSEVLLNSFCIKQTDDGLDYIQVNYNEATKKDQGDETTYNQYE